MSNMKIVDVRGLQHHLGQYLDEVEKGETLEVRRRRKVIARIVPYSEGKPAEPWPDLFKRLLEVYPEDLPEVSATEQLNQDRDKE